MWGTLAAFSIQNGCPFGAQAMCLRLHGTRLVEKTHEHLPVQKWFRAWTGRAYAWEFLDRKTKNAHEHATGKEATQQAVAHASNNSKTNGAKHHDAAPGLPKTSSGYSISDKKSRKHRSR